MSEATNPPSHPTINYQPEIDGLRAIAVISVILFHLKIPFLNSTFLPGGFIGVDIFFVISGYLITLIILKETQSKTFSFKSFYERRARRLLPLLLVVLLSTIPFSFLLLDPAALLEYSKSLLASLFFSSNIFFAYQDSYWAVPSSLKPLLHTWSLALEEQFYFVFPPLLVFVIQKFKHRVLFFLLGLLSISFITALYFTPKFPQESFFLIFTRMWELLVGCLLAYLAYSKTGPNFQNLALRKILFGLGLLILFVSFFSFNGKTIHPHLKTLLPILGTFCVVYFNPKEGFFYRILCSLPFLKIGLLSYGLYLWHFPIIVFGRHFFPEHQAWTYLLYLILSFVLSFCTYYFIERPFRNSQTTSFKKFFFSVVILLSLLLTFSFAAIKTNGFIQRLPYSLEGSERDFFTYNNTSCHDRIDSCVINNPQSEKSYVLVGDSHAGAISGELGPMLSKQGTYAQFTRGACPHIKFIVDAEGDETRNSLCISQTNKFIDYISKHKNLTIIHLAAYNLWLNGRPDEGRPLLKSTNQFSVSENIKTDLLAWLKLNHKVILILQPPEFPRDFLKTSTQPLAMYSLKNSEFYLKERISLRSLKFKNVIDTINHPNLTVVDVSDLFCGPTNCSPFKDEKILYTDGDHLSKNGARLIKNKILDFVD